MKEKTLEHIKEEAKKYFDGACPSHDWGHVERVRDTALNIGRKENADLLIVEVSALLHDTGRKKEEENPDKFNHAEISAEIAEEILKRYEFDKEKINRVKHCVISHRFRGNGSEPKTIEAMVLFDADKLDCIGAIGIARAYAWAGSKGIKLYSNKDYLGTGYEKEHSPLTEFKYKLSKVKDMMKTRTGKINAYYRHERMEKFFQALENETRAMII